MRISKKRSYDGMSFRAKGLGVAIAVSAALCAAAAPAGALFLPATPPSFGSPGTEAGQLSSPTAIAANDLTHDVYVTDTANARIEEFSAEGAFVRAWGWGVADGKEELEVCEASCLPGLPGAGNGQFANPVGIAVDNSTGASKEDVYVADGANNVVQKFDAEGKYLGKIDGSTTPQGVFQGLNGVAVDGQGDLWTIDSVTGDVDEFDTAGAYVAGSQFGDGYPATAAIAINSAATRLYLMNGANHNATEAWDPANPGAGATLIDNGGSAFSSNPSFYQGTSLTVDAASGDLYVEDVGLSGFASLATVMRYDSAGNLLEHLAPGTIAVPSLFAEPPQSQGLAYDPAAQYPNARSGALYAVENPNDDVRIFAPAAVDLSTGQAANILDVGATLNGTVDPEGVALNDCHFEYVTQAEFEAEGFTGLGVQSAACVPVAASIPADSEAHPVSAAIIALTPDTPYRFRLAASNTFGLATGESQAFTTQFPFVPPTIASAVATLVNATSAELKAQVNPNYFDAHAHFEYVTAAQFAVSGYAGAASTADLDIGSSGGSEGERSTFGQLSGLTPATTYHYRVIADGDVNGTTLTAESLDQTFTTQAVPPAPAPVGVVNPAVEAASAGATPTPPAGYPDITALRPIPAAKEPAGKPKAKAKPCRRGFVKKRGRCVKQARARKASGGGHR